MAFWAHHDARSRPSWRVFGPAWSLSVKNLVLDGEGTDETEGQDAGLEVHTPDIEQVGEESLKIPMADDLKIVLMWSHINRTPGKT